MARIDEEDPIDDRSQEEREADEAFDRLVAGPMGVVMRNSSMRRSVSLLSLEDDTQEPLIQPEQRVA